MLETLVNSLFSKKRDLPPYLRVPFPASGLRMKESLPFKKSVAAPREEGYWAYHDVDTTTGAAESE
jgi:hypothetical protein